MYSISIVKARNLKLDPKVTQNTFLRKHLRWFFIAGLLQIHQFPFSMSVQWTPVSLCSCATRSQITEKQNVCFLFICWTKSTSRWCVSFQHHPQSKKRVNVIKFGDSNTHRWWGMCNTSFTIWHHWESQHIPETPETVTPSSDVRLSPQQVKSRYQWLDCDEEMVFSLSPMLLPGL